MRARNLVVVDWTRDVAQISVHRKSLKGWQYASELTLPARLIVKADAGGQTSVVIGKALDQLSDEPDSVVFEHPASQLASFENLELATLLCESFWRALSDILVDSGHLPAKDDAAGYMIVPTRFSRPLRESLRTAAAKQRPLKFVASIDEAAALIIGAFCDGFIYPEASAQTRAQTVCLVVASDEMSIDVACFDYAQARQKHHQILIRDCFQTTAAELPKRLHDCDWISEFLVLVIIEDAKLSPSVSEMLDVPLKAIADNVLVQRLKSATTLQLRLRGGVHIAMCASGRGLDDHVYDVTHACHIGLQIDHQSFRPLIDKRAWAHVTQFPHVEAQGFRLRGTTGSSLRLNLFNGYSTRIAEAAPLGHLVLDRRDLSQLNKKTCLTAVLNLNEAGGGEFLVGLMPENRLLHRLPFNLPGLVV